MSENLKCLGRKIFFCREEKLFFLLENPLFPVELFLSLIMRELQKLAKKSKISLQFYTAMLFRNEDKKFL